MKELILAPLHRFLNCTLHLLEVRWDITCISECFVSDLGCMIRFRKAHIMSVSQSLEGKSSCDKILSWILKISISQLIPRFHSNVTIDSQPSVPLYTDAAYDENRPTVQQRNGMCQKCLFTGRIPQYTARFCLLSSLLRPMTVQWHVTFQLSNAIRSVDF